jgi:hypothetical protein
VIAVLAIASQLGSTPARGNGQSPGIQPSAAGQAMVTVRAADLIGRPVGVVARELRERGLVVRVRWQRSAAEPPRTVLAVLPAGRVPAGSRVTVTGALAPPGHDKGKDGGGGGQGKGKGKGDGNGKGHGHGGGPGRD